MKDPKYTWLIVGLLLATVCFGLVIATAMGDLPPPGYEPPLDITMNTTAEVVG